MGGLTLPIYEYPHAQGDCAITGGMVYRGPNFPRLQGLYFFADYCTGRLRTLSRLIADVWKADTLLDTGFQVTTFGEDEAGTLYLADYSGGRILRLEDAVRVFSAPTGQKVIAYPPTASPSADIDPGLSKPIGLGPVALGFNIFDLQVSLPAFSDPVDVYFAVYVPNIDASQPYLLAANYSLHPVSEGTFAWKSAVSSPIDAHLTGPIPRAQLPGGEYIFYLVVTPAGSLADYYLWATSISLH
jgi:hypothetical protein